MTQDNLPTRQSRISAVALHIATLEPGQQITHDELRESLGLDTRQTNDMGIWQSARHKAVDEHGVVLRSIRGVGYVRLTNEEVADDDGRMRRVRRQAGRGLAEAATVDPTTLDPSLAHKHAAKSLVFAGIVTQTRPSVLRAGIITSPSAARALLNAQETDE
jgi:hypothetical protein